MKTAIDIANDIDEILTRLEDYTHGKDGDDITRCRGYIIDLRAKLKKQPTGYSKDDVAVEKRMINPRKIYMCHWCNSEEVGREMQLCKKCSNDA